MPLKTSKSSDPWAALLQKAMGNREVRPTGKGWKTLEEFTEDEKLGVNRAKMLMRNMVRAGFVDTFVGKVLNEQGYLTRQVWYRPSETTNKSQKRLG